MGNELGPVFLHCRQKFIATTRVWDIYCVLFGNKERVDLLNRSSGFVAMHLHWQFLGGTILGLLRLLDPPATMGKPNLTFRSLPKLVSVDLANELAERVESLRNLCNGLKNVRDKILAHNDLRQVAGEEEPIEIESRKAITQIVMEMLGVLNLIENHYMKAITVIQPFGNEPAYKLLHRLWLADFLLSRSSKNRTSEAFAIAPNELLQTPGYLKTTDEEDRRCN